MPLYIFSIDTASGPANDNPAMYVCKYMVHHVIFPAVARYQTEGRIPSSLMIVV